MLKNEIDVLVIAHNICTAFDYLTLKEQEQFIRRLREIEKDVCAESTRKRVTLEGEKAKE